MHGYLFITVSFLHNENSLNVTDNQDFIYNLNYFDENGYLYSQISIKHFFYLLANNLPLEYYEKLNAMCYISVSLLCFIA